MNSILSLLAVAALLSSGAFAVNETSVSEVSSIVPVVKAEKATKPTLPSGIPAWDGSTKTIWSNGAGTAASPYLIENAANLAYLASQVTAGTTYEGTYFKLSQDIDINNKAFASIGAYSAKPFKGVFDGDNHVIHNFKNAAVSNAGLFACSRYPTVIKNFQITGTMTGTNRLAIVRDSSGTLKNITSWVDINGSMTTDDEIGWLGGILGASTSGVSTTEVLDCVNYGNITLNWARSTSTVTKAKHYVGGIAGAPTWGNGTKMENCINYGDITCTGACEVIGGIGSSFTKAISTVTNCANYGKISNTTVVSSAITGGCFGYIDAATASKLYNYGEVTCNQNQVGGIAGRISGTAKVSECENHANVTAKNVVGGICGTAQTHSVITSCLTQGNVTATSATADQAGLVVGYLGGPKVKDTDPDGDGTIFDFESKAQSGTLKIGTATVNKWIGTNKNITVAKYFQGQILGFASTRLVDDYTPNDAHIAVADRTFNGWCTDELLVTPWTGAGTKLTANLNLYGKFALPKASVIALAENANSCTITAEEFKVLQQEVNALTASEIADVKATSFTDVGGTVTIGEKLAFIEGRLASEAQSAITVINATQSRQVAAIAAIVCFGAIVAAVALSKKRKVTK